VHIRVHGHSGQRIKTKQLNISQKSHDHVFENKWGKAKVSLSLCTPYGNVRGPAVLLYLFLTLPLGEVE